MPKYRRLNARKTRNPPRRCKNLLDVISDSNKAPELNCEHMENENATLDNQNIQPLQQKNTSSSVKSSYQNTSIGSVKLKGRRLFSLASITQCIKIILAHGNNCNESEIQILDENFFGLRSVFTLACQKCNWTWKLDTDNSEHDLPVNEALSWGTLSSGSTYSASTNLLTVLECHSPNFHTYKKCENTTSAKWSTALQEEIIENGKEEHKLAKLRGNVVLLNGKDYAYTTVYCDGGWGKRSYGHTYNSLSGCAVIVGHLTKKILYYGIRNKFCMICKLDEHGPRRSHVCFKNWQENQSSSSMETDILTEGFKASIDMHGLIYKQFVADGDSSVYVNLLSNVDYGNIRIQKIECINHVIKRFNKSIFEMSNDSKSYLLVERKLLKKHINRFGRGLRCAVIFHNKQNLADSVEKLCANIKNIPFHIFGQHINCSDNYCTKERRMEKNEVPNLLHTKMWSSLTEIVERIADLSSRIIHNITSNRAESFMGKCSKFLLGKRLNVYQRGGYNSRVVAAGLSYSNGSSFVTNTFKQIEKASPCVIWKNAKRKSMRTRKPRLKRRKLDYFKENKVKGSGDGADYGENHLESDMDSMTLKTKISAKIAALQVDSESRNSIERQTIGQSANHLWFFYRKDRITASIAGRIHSLGDKTSNVSIVLQITKPDPRLQFLDSMKHGTATEGQAKRIYTSVTGNVIIECGLFVSVENGVLAASPDGLVGQDGIVEIKCPISMLGHDPKTMPEVMKSSYLQRNNDGKLCLKTSHCYYKQVIMQLYVTGRIWCDFVVYSYQIVNGIHIPFDPFIQRIERNLATDGLWSHMSEKLIKFYKEDLAPELVDSRCNRSMPIRQPKYRRDAYNTKNRKTLDNSSAMEYTDDETFNQVLNTIVET